MNLKDFACDRSRLQHLGCINVLGILYFFLFVYPYMGQGSAGQPWQVSAALYILVTNYLLWILSFNLWVWRITWVFLCVSAAFADYFMSLYGIDINRDVMVVFFQATLREVDSFAKIDILTRALPGVLLSTIGLALVREPSKNNDKIIRRTTLSMACIMGGVYTQSTPNLDAYIPYNYLLSSLEYYNYIQGFDKKMSRRRDIGEKAGTYKNPDSNPLFVVLVIGESARADHFSLNGYERETNPLLSKVPNLVNFPDTTSCGVYTSVSVPCMLTRATKANKRLMFNETSVVSVFKKLGFETYWYGAQGTFSPKDPITYVSSEAKYHTFFLPSSNGKRAFDEELLPYLERTFVNKNNSFIVLHTTGSHLKYSDRYSEKFKVFLPTCGLAKTVSNNTWLNNLFGKGGAASRKQVSENKKTPECNSQQGLINTYDNTILYTDWFLREVIKKLEDKNALFIYVSDHGESLGENGKYMHGHSDEPSNWHVPMMWWASDEFIKYNQKKWDIIQSKSQQSVTQGYIFHSLLDCVGIDSTLINKDLSLCN